MDPDTYKREVARLSSEVSSLGTDISTDVKPSAGGVGILKHTNYVLISLGTFLLLYLVKPKMVLKIMVTDENPQIVVDASKFILCWLVLTGVSSLILFTYLKARKKP